MLPLHRTKRHPHLITNPTLQNNPTPTPYSPIPRIEKYTLSNNKLQEIHKKTPPHNMHFASYMPTDGSRNTESSFEFCAPGRWVKKALRHLRHRVSSFSFSMSTSLFFLFCYLPLSLTRLNLAGLKATCVVF